MSSSDLAISVRALSKSYSISHRHEQEITLAEQALRRARHPFTRAERETFWALDDVSFDVRKGEVLGVIGRNGAGKSTLLKVLSRITAPTKGEVRLYGRVGSLLEVGTGFHPELTGRENVYLNGSILGMRRKEIDAQFDALVDFAGVEKFLDTPVKRYSSGMYVRLAFAVAAHLDTEILLVDEVLAVGDAEFQKKCLGKMGDAARGGRAVLLVSHNMAPIEALAPVALEMKAGKALQIGSTKQVIARYLESQSSLTGARDLLTAPRAPGPQTDALRIIGATPVEHHHNDDSALLSVTVRNTNLDAAAFGIVATFHQADGTPAATATVTSLAAPPRGACASFELLIQVGSLVPGRYSVLIAAVTFSASYGHTNHDIVPDAVMVEIDGPTSTAKIDGRRHWPASWGAHALDARIACLELPPR
jgi:ABC-type polysaccharide/polyol phosphate transport system ATPase subunit